MPIKWLDYTCPDLYTGTNCSTSWWDENESLATTVFTVFSCIFGILFFIFSGLFLAEPNKRKFSVRCKLLAAASLQTLAMIVGLSTGGTMKYDLKTSEGKTSLIFFLLMLSLIGEVSKNYAYMMLISTNNALTLRGYLDLLISSRPFQIFLNPWYMHIAFFILSVLVLADNEYLVSDRAKTMRIAYGVGGVYVTVASCAVLFSVNKLIKQLGLVLRSSQLAVGSNQSTMGEMRRLRNRLHGMKWFLYVETPFIAIFIFLLTISDLMSEPVIYFTFTTIVVLTNCVGNSAMAFILLPKRSLCSKEEKTESYASYASFAENTNTKFDSTV